MKNRCLTSLRTTYDGNHYFEEELRPPLVKKWTLRAPKGGFTGTVAAHGKVYAAVGIKKGIVAIDGEAGEFLWQKLDRYRHEAGGLSLVGETSLHYHEVNLRSGSYSVFLDTQTGEITHEWSDIYIPSGEINGKAAFAHREAPCFADMSTLERFDLPVWKHVNFLPGGLPLETGKLLCQGSGFDTDHVVIVDPESGELQHKLPGKTPVCACGGFAIIAPCPPGNLLTPEDAQPAYLVDIKNGKKLWEVGRNENAPIHLCKAVIHPERGLVVLMLRSSVSPGIDTIECRDVKTGDQVWRREIPNPNFDDSIPWMILTGNTIWCLQRIPAKTQTGKDHYVVSARSLEDGSEQWKTRESGHSPRIFDNKVFLTTSQGMKAFSGTL